MSRLHKPAKKATSVSSEAGRTNVLLEAMGKEIRAVAEGMVDLHPRIVRLEAAVASLTEDMKLLKSAVESLSEDMRWLKSAVQSLSEDMKLLKPCVERIEKRLESAEAKLAT
jgi:chromosome segregation ATPase